MFLSFFFIVVSKFLNISSSIGLFFLCFQFWYVSIPIDPSYHTRKDSIRLMNPKLHVLLYILT